MKNDAIEKDEVITTLAVAAFIGMFVVAVLLSVAVGMLFGTPFGLLSCAAFVLLFVFAALRGKKRRKRQIEAENDKTAD